MSLPQSIGSGIQLTKEALPWEPVDAIPCVDEDMRVIMTFPPLWSMAVTSDALHPLPELEPPSIVFPDLCGESSALVRAVRAVLMLTDDEELEEPIFRNLKKPEPMAEAARPGSVQSRNGDRPARVATQVGKAHLSSTRSTLAPHARVTRPPVSTVRPSMKEPNARITKPPVPRLGARSAVPAIKTSAVRTHGTSNSAKPDATSMPAPTADSFDMALLGETTPILFDDMNFGFDSDDDFNALETP